MTDPDIGAVEAVAAALLDSWGYGENKTRHIPRAVEDKAHRDAQVAVCTLDARRRAQM